MPIQFGFVLVGSLIFEIGSQASLMDPFNFPCSGFGLTRYLSSVFVSGRLDFRFHSALLELILDFLILWIQNWLARCDVSTHSRTYFFVLWIYVPCCFITTPHKFQPHSRAPSVSLLLRTNEGPQNKNKQRIFFQSIMAPLEPSSTRGIAVEGSTLSLSEPLICPADDENDAVAQCRESSATIVDDQVQSPRNDNHFRERQASRNVRLTLAFTFLYYAGRSLWNQNVLATFIYILRDGNPEGE